jgi:glycogen(starch) synthase
MRICLVSWEYPPLVVGGIAPHVEGIATAYAAAGHDVVVLTRFDERAPADSVVDGVRVLRAHVDLPWAPNENLVAQVASGNHKLTQLSAALPGWRPDVVHAHDWLVSWAGDTLAAIWGVPLVATIHATERGRHQGYLTNPMSQTINATEWWLTYQAREVIACSGFMVDEVLTAFAPPAEKVTMIPNGVDASAWAPPGVTDRTGRPTVVSWGRLQYEKGFQTLIEATADLRGRFPDLDVVIVGRGSYTEELQHLANTLGVADLVRFTGFTPDADLKALLHRANAAVIPSLYEPFGIVALEALAAEAPLVASTAGGLGEILGGTDAAELFKPGDRAGLATALAAVLGDAAAAARHQRLGRALVRDRYSWHTIAEQTLTVYERAIATRS